MFTRHKLNLTKEFKIISIGQEIYFRNTSFEGSLGNMQGEFLPYTFFKDWKSQLIKIQEKNPDLVLIYRPEVFDKEFLKILKENYITIGYFTEPLPFGEYKNHPDLLTRFSFIEKYDFNSCDEYIFYNPVTNKILNQFCKPILIHPLPVNDLVYSKNYNLKTDRIRGLFVGRVSEYRNNFLMPLKHYWDWTVIDHGMMGIEYESHFNISLNLHSESYPNFENRILLHMAKGLVVFTQPLVTNFDLKKNKHFIQFSTVEELNNLVDYYSKNLSELTKIQENSVNKVEDYKASTFMQNVVEILFRKRQDLFR